MNKNFSVLDRIIKQSHRVLVVIHPSPDGDAVGSLSAFSGYLNFLGLQNKGFCIDTIPHSFKFLPWVSNNVLTNTYDVFRFSPDLIVLLDINEVKRAGIYEYILHKDKVRTVVLDHHIVFDYSEIKKFDFSYIDKTYSSTTHILVDFFKEVGFDAPTSISDSLLFGMMTDTEVFTNSITTDYALKTAYELLKSGARFSKLLDRMRRYRTMQDLKNFGYVFENIVYNKKYNILVSFIAKDSTIGASDVSNYLKRVSGVDAVFAVKQMDDRKVKISMRSLNDKINVAEFAQLFGGGGHKMAASFSINGVIKKKEDKFFIL